MNRVGFGFEAVTCDLAAQRCAQQAVHAAAGGAVDIVANKPVYCEQTNTWQATCLAQVPADQFSSLMAYLASVGADK